MSGRTSKYKVIEKDGHYMVYVLDREKATFPSKTMADDFVEFLKKLEKI